MQRETLRYRFIVVYRGELNMTLDFCDKFLGTLRVDSVTGCQMDKSGLKFALIHVKKQTRTSVIRKSIGVYNKHPSTTVATKIHLAGPTGEQDDILFKVQYKTPDNYDLRVQWEQCLEQIVDRKDGSYWCESREHKWTKNKNRQEGLYDVTKEINRIQKQKADDATIDTASVENLMEFSEAVLSALDNLCVIEAELREKDNLVTAHDFGHVYAAWNSLFPDLVKIGATRADSPYTRVKSLSSAGIPTDFELVASIPTIHPFRLEHQIHQRFAHLRREGRHKEFFFLSKQTVSMYFGNIVENQFITAKK